MRRLFEAATIRSTDVAATIYFSSTAMQRLFEGGYYSKYRRRGDYLFQLYRNAATIRGRLLFEVQTSRLLFISALPQCSDYSRAATILSTDVAATIYFSSTAMRRLLFEVQTSRLLFISALPQCGDYSRQLLFEVQTSRLLFISALMQRLFKGSYYSKYRCRGYYLFQLYHNAATIQGWLLFEVQTSRYYLFQRYRSVVTIRGRLLFEVQTSRLLCISALPQCSDYSKYRRRGDYLFQLYRNAATIRGRLLFEVQTSRLLFISALPQSSDYSRAATILSTDVAATIYFSSTAMRRLLFEVQTSRLLFISALPQCGDYYSKYRRRGYYLFQLYRNAATIRGSYYSKYRRRGYYSFQLYRNAATIQGSYYSKYRHRGYYLFQLYRNAATIQGQLLFEVQMSRLLFISALPQCGDYSRVAII